MGPDVSPAYLGVPLSCDCCPFDQWVLGPGTEDTHVIPAGRRAWVSRTAGWIAPTVVVGGGLVSGTWSLNRDRVAVKWFSELGAMPRSALEADVERLSGLIGRPLELALEPSS